MSKFSAGAKVAFSLYGFVGYTGTVLTTSTESYGDVVYILRDDGVAGTGPHGAWRTVPEYLTLIQPAADEGLPPVPKSVLYTEDAGKVYNLKVAASFDCISITVGAAGEYKNGIVLEPDAVLQLCHDLRRMAMQIKREQKQEMMKDEDI